MQEFAAARAAIQSEHTSPEAEALLIAAWRTRKLECMLELSRASDALATAGILAEHPGAGAGDTMVRVFDWDPRERGN